MLSCNGIVLNYVFVLYNKSIFKIDIVQSIARELPVPPVMSYFLCDCWYVSEKIISTFVKREFHMSTGFLPVSIAKENRLDYHNALEAYAVRGELGEFAGLVAELEEEQLDTCMKLSQR